VRESAQPESKPKSTIGRPRKGSIADGIEKVGLYPKLAISARPSTKAKLKAVSDVEGRAAWLIVDDAICSYVERMTPKDRQAVEYLAARNKEK
jgi:hypothetical protein